MNAEQDYKSEKQTKTKNNSEHMIIRKILFIFMISMLAISLTQFTGCKKDDKDNEPANDTPEDPPNDDDDDSIPAMTLIGERYYGPIQSLKIGENREFIINNKPFFPIMSWYQSSNKYSQHEAVWINPHAGPSANPNIAPNYQAYTIPDYTPSMKAGGNIIACIFDDEPDLPSGSPQQPRMSPEEVATKCSAIRTSSPGLLIFMTLTSSFMNEVTTYSKATKELIYPQYISSADIVGFDYYPIYGSGYPSRLDWVGRGTAQLRNLAGKKPVYAWIETSKGSQWMTYEKQPDVLPEHTRNEVWQAIIEGATAIGYFTHAWRPTFTDFAPNQDMLNELARLNKQITRLAPAILASPADINITMTMSDNLKCLFKTTTNKDGLFIFALNMDLGPGAASAKQFDPIFPRSGTATFNVAGLKKGTLIEVIDEKRTITAEAGSFTDSFEPLAEHIYRIAKIK